MNVQFFLLHSMLSTMMLVTSIPAVAADEPVSTRSFMQEEQHSRIQKFEQQMQKLQAVVAEKTPLVSVTEGGEFILSAKDGSYTLRPTMRMQLQHRAEIIEDAPNTNGFFLRRGRFGVGGNAINTDLKYKLEFDFGTPDPGDPNHSLY